MWIKVYNNENRVDTLLHEEKILFNRPNNDYFEIVEEDLEKFFNILQEKNIEYTNWGTSVFINGYHTVDSDYLSTSYLANLGKKVTKEHQIKTVFNCEKVSKPRFEETKLDGKFYFHLGTLPISLTPVIDDRIFDYDLADKITFKNGKKINPKENNSSAYIQLFCDRQVRKWIKDSKLEEDENFTILTSKDDKYILGFTLYNHAWIIVRMRNQNDYGVTAKAPTALKWYPLFQEILDDFASKIGDPEEFLSYIKQQKEEEQFNNWTKLVAGRHEDRIKETRELLEEQVTSIEEKRKELTELMRKIPEIQTALAIAEEFEVNKDDLRLEFDKLHKNPLFSEVEISDDGETFIVTTNMITMDGEKDVITKNEALKNQWKDYIIPIGSFRLELTASGSARITNLTNAKDGSSGERHWQHPHVPRGGACFGTIERSLPNLLSKYCFGEAAVLLVKYLSCCNADDPWGKNISLWRDDAILKNSEEASTLLNQ